MLVGTLDPQSSCVRSFLDRRRRAVNIVYGVLLAILLSTVVGQAVQYVHMTEARDLQMAENQLWLETINRVPVAVVIVDADTARVVGYSEGAEHVFGWNAKEVMSTPIFSLMPDEYAKDHIERLKSKAVRERLSVETVKITCRMLKKDSIEPIMCSVTIRGVPTDDRYRFLLVVEKSDSIRELPYQPRVLSVPTAPAQPQVNRKPYADLLPPIKNIPTPTRPGLNWASPVTTQRK